MVHLVASLTGLVNALKAGLAQIAQNECVHKICMDRNARKLVNAMKTIRKCAIHGQGNAFVNLDGHQIIVIAHVHI
jgi:ribosomal protein L40E